MNLAAKLGELKGFIRKWGEHKITDTKLNEIDQYLVGWEKELRGDLGLPEKPFNVIGTSVSEDVQLDAMPSFGLIQPGFYHRFDNPTKKIEVIRQDSENGVVFYQATLLDGVSSVQFMCWQSFWDLFEEE